MCRASTRAKCIDRDGLDCWSEHVNCCFALKFVPEEFLIARISATKVDTIDIMQTFNRADHQVHSWGVFRVVWVERQIVANRYLVSDGRNPEGDWFGVEIEDMSLQPPIVGLEF